MAKYDLTINQKEVLGKLVAASRSLSLTEFRIDQVDNGPSVVFRKTASGPMASVACSLGDLTALKNAQLLTLNPDFNGVITIEGFAAFDGNFRIKGDSISKTKAFVGAIATAVIIAVSTSWFLREAKLDIPPPPPPPPPISKVTFGVTADFNGQPVTTITTLTSVTALGTTVNSGDPPKPLSVSLSLPDNATIIKKWAEWPLERESNNVDQTETVVTGITIKGSVVTAAGLLASRGHKSGRATGWLSVAAKYTIPQVTQVPVLGKDIGPIPSQAETVSKALPTEFGDVKAIRVNCSREGSTAILDSDSISIPPGDTSLITGMSDNGGFKIDYQAGRVAITRIGTLLQ